MMRSAPSVLIVSTGEKSGKIISNLIDPAFEAQIQYEKSGASTRRRIQREKFDLIVVNSPLSDEFGHELASDLARDTSAGIILLIKTDVFDEVTDKVSDDGVITIAKPISGQLFSQAVRIGLEVSMRVSRVEKENLKIKEKLEETRVVGRAKCLLVENMGISESEAHRMIEKRAMDTRRTRKTVAEEILRTYIV